MPLFGTRLQPSPFSKIMHMTKKELFFMAIPSEGQAVEYAPIHMLKAFPAQAQRLCQKD